MLNQKTSKRIEADAAEKYPPGRFSTQWLRDRELDRQQAYVNGASAEAERAQGLVECLLRVRKYVHSTGVIESIDETLTKYNNSKD